MALLGVNSFLLGQNDCRFADDIFRCIFEHQTFCLLIKISLKFFLRCSISNIPALFQIITLHRPGDKPLYEPNMVNLLTHICVTQPEWANRNGGDNKCLMHRWMHYIQVKRRKHLMKYMISHLFSFFWRVASVKLELRFILKLTF